MDKAAVRGFMGLKARDKFTSLADMFDGGGAGASGQTFQGGLFSGLLNNMGVRPMGFDERLADARPMARPDQPAIQSTYQPPIHQSTLPPQAAPQAQANAIPAMGANLPPAMGLPMPATQMPNMQEALDMYRKRLGERADAGWFLSQQFPPTYR